MKEKLEQRVAQFSEWLITEAGKRVVTFLYVGIWGFIIIISINAERGFNIGKEIDETKAEFKKEITDLKQNDSLLFRNDQVQVNNDLIISNKQDSTIMILRDIHEDIEYDRELLIELYKSSLNK